MRQVEFDPSKLDTPVGWMEKAALLKEKLIKAEDGAARMAIIGENEIWKEVKAALKKQFNGKCWYTESVQEGTDVDVDHYRPKGRVAELANCQPPHPGYWWLAYELANYRYSCIVANRRRKDIESGRTGGKADHFPILDESERALSPDSDYEVERPLLIDPCKATDVVLVSFKEDGEAMPRWGEQEKYKNEKAKKSIELYSLNHSDFVRARIALRDEMENLRIEARRFFLRLENGDAAHEQAYTNAINKLRGMRRNTAPYSGFCVAFLDNLREEEYLAPVFV